MVQEEEGDPMEWLWWVGKDGTSLQRLHHWSPHKTQEANIFFSLQEFTETAVLCLRGPNFFASSFKHIHDEGTGMQSFGKLLYLSCTQKTTF